MYHPYHEMSMELFYEAMDKKMESRIGETKLRKVRDAVGYDNTSYFHRIFQKQFGMTPR